MKKSYVKPKVYFENFQLSANIATGCGIATNQAMGTCNFLVGLGTLFDKDNVCQYVPDESGVCYQISIDDQKVFTS